jgi:hypothetical protein
VRNNAHRGRAALRALLRTLVANIDARLDSQPPFIPTGRYYSLTVGIRARKALGSGSGARRSRRARCAVVRNVRVRVRVLLQPCARRVFPLAEFLAVRSVLSLQWTRVLMCGQAVATRERAHITVRMKETPLGELLTSAVAHPLKDGELAPLTHFMFSHTIQGQAYDMPLLSRFLPSCLGAPASAPAGGGSAAPLPPLVDSELLCGPDGKRTVAFGWLRTFTHASCGLPTGRD